MKQSQWILAAILLAALIFGATFAMNYLGDRGQSDIEFVVPQAAAHEVLFANKVFPPNGSVLEREERSSGYADYWFYNPADETVQLGLDHKNCQCGSVEVFVLPEERRTWLAREVAALVGVTPLSPLAPAILHALAMPRLQDGLDGHELLNKTEKAPIGPRKVGWVRLRWSARKPGPLVLTAQFWFDNPGSAMIATLNLNLYFHEPLRVVSRIRIRPLRDEDLERGVTEYINCWSSTRSSLRLEASTLALRGNPASDPFVVGKPEPLSPSEVHQLQRANNEGSATMSQETRGQVLCAYRIPITFRAISADGKTPFDLGPFQRVVNIRSPDIDADPVSVTVLGRVRGLVQIGQVGEEISEIKFETFRRNRGKVVDVQVESQNQALALEFDRTRTSEFLDASLSRNTDAPEGRQMWTLHAKVLPNKAEGDFPRAKDPLYEDSAIYLKALLPGKAPRSIRIPVRGSARDR